MARKKLSLYWQRFTLALLVIACGGVAIVVLAPDLSGLFLFGLYSMPANSLLPVPHEPGLLYVAQYYPPWAVALAGTAGTAIAACVDYPVVQRAFKHPKLQRARHTRAYAAAVRWLMRYPFATVFLFAATPLPVYVVRVLAPASGYPLWRYTLATALGRYPRYLVVAYFGHFIHLPGWSLLLMFALMVGGMLWAAYRTRGENYDGIDVLAADDDLAKDEAALLARNPDAPPR